MYVYIYVYIHIYMNIHIYVYIYMYIHIYICDRICENVPYDQNEHSSIKLFLEPDVNFYEISFFVVFDI